MFNRKYLIVFLALLFACMSVAVAADVDDSTADATVTTDDAPMSISNVQEQTTASEDNIITKETRNLKQDSTTIQVNNDNFDTYFKSTGFGSNVNDGDSFLFTGNVSRYNNTTYLVNKQVNIDGDNHTITLNTTSGSYFGNETGSSFIFDNGSAGSTVSNINFYNTQVIVRNTTNIIFDNIDQTVSNQRIGQGIGTFSIRDASSYITVENSAFSTTNNNGSSTLVLADAQHCTIDNNTITGVGDVGNLLYLTTYNIATNLTVDSNSYNLIQYNTINGPSTTSAICWAVVLSGHNNTLFNNTINYAGTAITTQALNVVDENNYQQQISVNNTINKNTVNNGGNLICIANNTIENNTIGKITLYSNAIARYNQVNGNAVINGYNNFTQNNVTGTTSISGKYSNVTYNNLLGQVTIKLTAKNNNVTNNNITTAIDNKGGNTNIINPNNIITPLSSLENSKQNIKRDSSEPIVITRSNYASYFTEEEDLNGKSALVYYGNNGNFYFNETIPNIRVIAFYGDNNIVTAKPGITFTNVGLVTYMGKNNLFANMSVRFLTSITASEYASPGAFYVQETYDGSTTFDNITVDYNIPTLIGAYEEWYPVGIIEIKSDSTIKNCNININTVSTTVDWEPGSDTYGLNKIIPISIYGDVIDSIHQINMTNNNITINANNSIGSYPTTYGINIKAPFNNSRIIGNNITMYAGEGWSYAIHPLSSGNLIEDNVITVSGINYTAGVGLENPKNNTVNNNTIIVKSSLDEHAYGGSSNEYCAYAIFINDYSYMGGVLNPDTAVAVDNVISNNHITGYAYNTYAFEQFGGKNTLIINNTIEIPSSNTAMAIGALACNISIINNNISLNGSSITGSTVDYLGAMTTGIFLGRGMNNTVTGNVINSTKYGMFLSSENNDVIQDNNVTTDFNCTIKLYGVRKTNVTNNYLISQELIGDASVDDYNGNDNVIQLNQPAEPVKEYSLKVDTTEFTQGTNATITATIYYGDDVATDISNGKVTFKVNGKTLKDANGKVIYAKVINGVATIENYVVPDDWSKDGTTIQAIYSGSTDCEKLTSEKTNITIIAEEPTLTTNDITATAGETITLTATITDNNKVINNGKIVFKINGKTVKDANGKVIYAKVVNNQVSVEYTLPADMKAKDYNITATFISSDYERIEDTKTLTITA